MSGAMPHYVRKTISTRCQICLGEIPYFLENYSFHKLHRQFYDSEKCKIKMKFLVRNPRPTTVDVLLPFRPQNLSATVEYLAVYNLKYFNDSVTNDATLKK